ncbi:D-glycerate dehydrogenase [Salinisphaera sp. Q1T1-3]|uniref:2-hydroxyacid dehydrogenase n=1 Tax=Salinisphaera sp. Q1T1-3 TaxID=2321229 RepID=UPI000E747396|nr:D-glycerate dehydrogenase [Salinisphaera sp. Q1T1-3]RJS94846.1 D-glycerate dehydrogenase [Salinisphaera sp. Q1T1-3]
MPSKTVLVYKSLDDALLERLRARYEVRDFSDRADITQDPDFLAALPDAHGLIGASVPLGGDLLRRASNLEVVSSVSVGVDNYDLASTAERGIVLCHTPDVLTETVADTALLLILATARRGVELSNLVRRGEWTGGIGPAHYGSDVHHKRLGIVGMGRIGQAIARRGAAGFGMTVRYHNRSGHSDIDAELGAEWQPLDTLLSESDIVCSTLPLSDRTAGMFGRQAFERMGAESFFVNIGRGGVVDEAALVDALRTNTIKAAGLDVFETEPLPAESPLLALDNVVVLPHIGSATHETRAAMAELAVSNLEAVLEDRQPPAAYPLAP